MEKEIFLQLLEKKEYKTIKNILDVMNAVDIAQSLSELEGADLALAFRLIPKDKAADTFAEMDNAEQAYLVEAFTEKELRRILDDLYMDDTVDMLEELPANLVNRILGNVSVEKRNLINVLLNYPEDSAGSIMTTEYVKLKPQDTVREALTLIKKTGIHKETIYTCYVLHHRKILGIVSAKDLLTMDDEMTMEELMETEVISVHTHTDKEEVAKLFSKYDFLAIPVVDDGERMVGIVTFDDAIDVMVDEATEDITKMAAIMPSEDTYMDTSVLHHAKDRIPWLFVLMFSATITGIITLKYQNLFSQMPVLVSFMPMLMDTGGNCGSQSSTLMIRGIALDQIHFRDIFKVMFKEFRISLICGAVLGAANALRVYLMHRDPLLALVIGLSLLFTIIIAKLIGCTLPLLAKQIRLDPALMASPLITTLVDACSISIYFLFASRVLF